MCVEKSNFENILKAKSKAKSLKNVILFDTDVTDEQLQRAKELDIKVIFYKDVIKAGEDCQQDIVFKEPTPDTVYIFCYTSGTTGDPKGAMLQHKSFVAFIPLFEYFGANFTEDDCTISFLPFAHLFEQAFFIFSWFFGF